MATYMISCVRPNPVSSRYLLRWCIRNEKDLRAKSFADKLAKYPHDPAGFWKGVSSLNISPPLASTVGGVSGAKDIGHM